MTTQRRRRAPRPLGLPRRSNSTRRTTRRSQIEWLEPRLVLAPTLAPLGDVTVLAGAPLHIALNSSGGQGELEFDATITGANLSHPSLASPELTTHIPEDNPSMKISVAPHADFPDGGDMVFELFEQRAERTTSQIIELAESHFYDGLTFHRIIETFMIQGGYLQPDGTARSPIDFVDDFHPFDDEFHPDLQHTSTGVLSMAKTEYDDSNSTQFFITADPATDPNLRPLDFNHSVFGFLTEGEDVRKAIADHGTSQSAVVMSSVTIVEDPENGVLMLSAPEGTTGEAYVTVTVSDDTGSTQQTFHVTVEADTHNANPYLPPIAPIETTVDTPVTFTLEGFDVEGDAISYYGEVGSENDDLAIQVGRWDGVTTVTPSNGLAGVHVIYVAAYKAEGWDEQSWDTQAVPVYITPGAPSQIELLTKSATNDQFTNRNNLGDDTLRFRVSGLVPGAEVSLYADGDDEPIGQTTAQYDSVVVITNGTFELSDGTHEITAVQALRDQEVIVGNLDETVDLVSVVSSPLGITVDTVPPEITSTPETEAAVGRLYSYNVDTVEEEAGEAVYYHLAAAPMGMSFVEPPDLVTWTPSDVHVKPQSVEVVAVDEAGNETRQAFQITVSPAPKLDFIGDKTVDEESTLSFTVSATGGEGTLVFSLDAGAPDGAEIPSGTNQFTWTPSEKQGPDTYGISIRVTDAIGASSRKTVWVTVREVNQAPVLSEIDDRTGDDSINEGQLLRFRAEATDADWPPNKLEFDLGSGYPAEAGIGLNTGWFNWTPDESQGGEEFVVTVRVWDQYGLSGVQTFTVAVNEVNNPPVFAPMETQTAVPGETLQIKVTAWDPDDAANARDVIYSLVSAPEGAEIDQTGQITWDVPEDFLGQHDPRLPVELIVRATEDAPEGEEALTATQTVRVMVQDPRVLIGFALSEVAAEGNEWLIGSLAQSRALPMAPPPAPVAPPAPFAPVEQEGVFGFRLGVGTSHGGSEEPEEETEEGETEEKPGDADGKEGDKPKTSDGETDDDQEASWRALLLEDLLAEIRDAAVERWADEEGEPVSPQSDDESPSAETFAEESSPAADRHEPSHATGESQQDDSGEESPRLTEPHRGPAVATKGYPAPSAAS